MFPNISWHKLDRSFVADGINRVRMLFPNMHVNSDKCQWLMECFESWEYRELSQAEDWAATPKHDRYSHLMDAVRYVADMVGQLDYVRTNDGKPREMPAYYPAWDDGGDDDWSDLPPGMRPSKFSKQRKKPPQRTDSGLWIP